MDYRKLVQAHLRQEGFDNVSQDLLDEFVNELRAEADSEILAASPPKSSARLPSMDESDWQDGISEISGLPYPLTRDEVLAQIRAMGYEGDVPTDMVDEFIAELRELHRGDENRGRAAAPRGAPEALRASAVAAETSRRALEAEIQSLGRFQPLGGSPRRGHVTYPDEPSTAGLASAVKADAGGNVRELLLSMDGGAATQSLSYTVPDRSTRRSPSPERDFGLGSGVRVTSPRRGASPLATNAHAPEEQYGEPAQVDFGHELSLLGDRLHDIDLALVRQQVLRQQAAARHGPETQESETLDLGESLDDVLGEPHLHEETLDDAFAPKRTTYADFNQENGAPPTQAAAPRQRRPLRETDPVNLYHRYNAEWSRSRFLRRVSSRAAPLWTTGANREFLASRLGVTVPAPGEAATPSGRRRHTARTG